MLTAKGQAYDRERGLEAGADLLPDEAVRPRRAARDRPQGPRAPGRRRADARSTSRRLIVRHRHVAPMLSALLRRTNAAVRIVDTDGKVILRAGGRPGIGDRALPDRRRRARTVGWVEGDRVARAVASVLSYADRPRGRQAQPRPRGARPLPRAEPGLRPGRDASSGLRSVAAIGQAVIAEIGPAARGRDGFLLVADPEGGRSPRRTACRSGRSTTSAEARASSARLGAASRGSSTTSRRIRGRHAAERALTAP